MTLAFDAGVAVLFDIPAHHPPTTGHEPLDTAAQVPQQQQRSASLMGWGRMDDGFDDHPKVVAILDRDDPMVAGFAIGLWTLAWTWAHRNTRKKGKTPGLIPPGLPRRWFGPAFREGAQLLVAHGLWDEHESGGWLIHDFADYLPTDSTREARSEAGKRGAAARWAGHQPAGDAGSDHNQDGNLPSGCHDEDGKAEANDGSRAPARWDPTPTPTPTPTPIPEPPSEVLFGEIVEPGKTRSRSTKGTRIPEDFAVTEDMIEWARKKTPNVGAAETEAFIDYFRGAPGSKGVKTDWAATWRNWMRRAQKDFAERRNQQGRLTGGMKSFPPPESNAPKRYSREERCTTHPSYPAHNCGPCRADRLAADREEVTA